MPVQATSGAASYDAFGGGVPVVPNYIEEVFSTWLYTATGANITVNNGIDLLGKGGMTIQKVRSTTSQWYVTDTDRGAGVVLYTNLVNGQANNGSGSGQFLSNGFVDTNQFTAGQTEVSYTFRKQPKFFDEITYTGGTLSVSHALASKPGCIFIKKTSGIGDWLVITRKSDGNIYAMYLNQTAGQFYDGTEGALWTSTDVSINWINSNVAAGYNDSGASYVMYLFAHNAGGFGVTGTDNVISCGSFTTDSNGTILPVNLSYEPQFLLLKATTAGGPWLLLDNMRGFGMKLNAYLQTQISAAESTATSFLIKPSATGFFSDLGTLANNTPYIYIAIRRGPMKVPATGTSVLGLNARTGNSTNTTVTGSAGPTDLVLIKNRGLNIEDLLVSRLNLTYGVATSSTTAEVLSGTTELQSNPWDVMDGIKVGTTSQKTNASSNTFINYLFKRAPSFFDQVYFENFASGGALAVSHNLTVVPELIIIKNLNSNTANWAVYNASLGPTKYILLNLTNAAATSSFFWNNTAPTASVFTVLANGFQDPSVEGRCFAYLFASCPGVSKIGSYSGTGALQTINCGFTSGARFVLIKRSDAVGDWFVWDSARGISSLNDPYFLLNNIAAEVTTTNYVDTDTTGFKVTAAAPAGINASGGSYIFFAIA